MAIESIIPVLFEIYKGDDTTYKIEIKDTTGAVVDVTGWSFKSTLKLDFTKDDDSATVTVDALNLSGTDAEAGILYLTYPHAQTKNLLPASYFFDIQTEIGGYVSTVVSGRVKVKPDTTHRET